MKKDRGPRKCFSREMFRSFSNRKWNGNVKKPREREKERDSDRKREGKRGGRKGGKEEGRETGKKDLICIMT